MEVQRRRSPDWWVDYIVVGGGEISAIVQQIVRGAHWEAANGPMEGSATKGGERTFCAWVCRIVVIEVVFYGLRFVGK